MQVGISLTSAYPGVSDADAPRFMLERARAASAAGLACLTVGDHHSTGPFPYVQNVPILARMLTEWDDRPIGCLFLVAAWHPVLMAEQIGTLAALHGGSFIVQTGLGDGHQMKAMGVPKGERGARLEEGITLVQALLAGETVSSERWGITEAAIAPRPTGPVEWWIGAVVEVALDRAARLGTGWYAGPETSLGSSSAQQEEYFRACERHRREPGAMAIRKDVFVADSNAEACALGDRLIEQGYRGMPREAVAYGDVDAVTEQLAPYVDLGFTHVMIRTMTAPQPEAVRSIELMGEVRARLEAL